MKISILFVFLITILHNTFSQSSNVIDTTCLSGIDEFINNHSNFQFYYKRNKIPSIMKRNISVWNGKKFKIANPGKKYNFDDEKRFGIPDKRLVFVAKNNLYAILVYDRGGIAPNRIMHICKNNRKDSFCEFYIPDYENIETLISYLKTGKLRLTPY